MQKLRLFGMNGVFALMLALTAGVVRGQNAGYLILVDAENKQPFTASIGETLMQSSTHGHLLIPQLQDSVYRLIIRFPRKSIPEQIFPVHIHKKDQGFQLQGADNSWILYNWQSKETIRPVKELDSSRLLELGVKREDGFSRLMAGVVNDSSVMYDTYAGAAFARDSVTRKGSMQDSSAPLVKTRMIPETGSRDSSSTVKIQRKPAKDSSIVKIQTKPETDTTTRKIPLENVAAVKSHIKKLREVSLKISRKIVFLDAMPGGEKDTVTLFVYFEQPEYAYALKKHPHEDPMVTARRLLRNDTATSKPSGMDKIKRGPSDKGLVKTDSGRVTPKPRLLCPQTANDPDVESLRSAILIRNTEQEKISVASGAFALKCFSVTQIRMLAELFVSDRAKYKFLVTAYLHVSDPDHFQELADLLMDKGYLKKFKALVEKRG